MPSLLLAAVAASLSVATVPNPGARAALFWGAAPDPAVGVEASPTLPSPERPLLPSEAFARGRVAFDRGEYARAITLLRPLLYPEIRLDEESQVVRSHRMLGVAHLFENQPEEARQEFLRLLELRPDYRFDPLLDPPRVVDFFNQILREQEGQIAALEARRRQAEATERLRAAEAAAPPKVIVREYERRSLAVALLPFGAGQFQNEQSAKGWAFLAAESTLAGVSMAAATANFLLYGAMSRLPCKDAPPVANGASGRCAGDDVDRTDERRSTLLLNVQLVSGGLFFAVAAWGIVDALLHFEARVPLGEPAPLSRPRVSFVPTLSPSGVGTHLELRF
ncbi:MAG: hypothetical protein KA712_25430 [Myxococcales bacterium]|nr:hypothetical protein [Myxococcales bacterium]